MKMKLFLLFFSFLFVACATPPTIKNAESTAEILYKRGLFYMQHKNWEMAEINFKKVISNYSFSKYQSLSIVALGDTAFGKEEYPTAIAYYSNFLKMNPENKMAEYAEMRLADAYFAQRPSDFFLLPNPAEKDLTTVKQAYNLYTEFLKKHPKSKYKKEVQKKLFKAEMLLVKRNISVAKFYAKTGHCKGTFSRINYIKQHFNLQSKEILNQISEMEQKCKNQ